MAGDFSDIMICCSISLMEVVSSFPFCYTFLSVVVLSSLAELVSIVIHETPAPFFLGSRNCRRLALSLGFSVVRRVWSFLSY